MVRFGDARFWDDFTRVDMSSRQIRQFMDPCKSTLKKKKEDEYRKRWQTMITLLIASGDGTKMLNEVVVVCLDRIYVYSNKKKFNFLFKSF